jgi:hypothetical protein
MNCREFEERLHLLVGGTIPGFLRESAHEHLAVCKRCRLLYGIARGEGEIPDPGVREDLTASILEKTSGGVFAGAALAAVGGAASAGCSALASGGGGGAASSQPTPPLKRITAAAQAKRTGKPHTPTGNCRLADADGIASGSLLRWRSIANRNSEFANSIQSLAGANPSLGYSLRNSSCVSSRGGAHVPSGWRSWITCRQAVGAGPALNCQRNSWPA